MKQEQRYLEDLTEIRSMMERSSRFLTLTGWSGILAGVYALLGAYLGYQLFAEVSQGDRYESGAPLIHHLPEILLLASTVMCLALGTALLLSYRRARNKGERIWTPSSRRLLLNLAIPLAAGGLFILILLSRGSVALVAPACLLFYGLALVNASKFTFEEVRVLGILEILLGLLAAWITGYGLLFWAMGFGLLHIVYGFYMQLKYER